MPLNHISANRTSTLILVSLIVALVMISCGGKNSLGKPQTYGTRQTETTPVNVTPSEGSDNETSASGPMTYANPSDVDSLPAEGASEEPVVEPPTVVTESKEEPKETVADKAPPKPSGDWSVTPGSPGRDEIETLVYYGKVDNEDSASAVDDAIWRMLDLADEYHSMGVVANRDASWEEAQYYFEKAIKIMAGLDIEADSIPTPEATKYEIILSNVISEYRVTLRSLGQLQGDITPSVLVERFGDMGDRLAHDTLLVYGRREREVTYDLPVKMNDRVKNSIVYFQTVAHDAFTKYLTRSKRYDRMFKEILTKHGMPLDFVYLSLVESGYNPKAYSWARASGLWQFIASTGRMYGLERSWWVDERRDPVKATEAAARFLKDLYKQFGDWELAMAAYNGGPGRVRATIRKQKTNDFWKMRLRRQTMDYVPLIYAAAIIAKEPARYGFHDIEHEPEVVWDEVIINRCLELKIVAQAVGCTVEELKNLNPELLRNYTPPNEKKYKLKIPRGSRHNFMASYSTMPSPRETSWVKHKIKRGETVSTIAAKYGVSQYAISESNNLNRRSRIYAGKTLIVPVPLDRDYSSSKSKKKETYASDGSVYTVRAGDTMWDIARAFGTTVNSLRRINYIGRGSRIYVGQKLKIPSNAKNLAKLNHPSGGRVKVASNDNSSESGSPNVQTHKVRAGDTLWDIARLYATTSSSLRRLNGLGRSSRIYPGQVLKVSGSGSTEYITYKVKRGDSLDRIARKYRTSISRILALNYLDDPDNIRIGQKLRIKIR
ncbi:MAG: LysM peptidoglycan-binding domain-containing protein [candidate division Zixibacteria bacterium]|nr:LysM peptidoglycan-binding domain-containing protein [candidate division Zixibacteria bacterium]